VRYKKIDSTLRGPLAAEAGPLLAAGAALLVCPAFPPAGRTVEDGVLRVRGTPVHETEIGRDRHNPVPESHLPTLLGALGRVGQVGAVDLELGRPGVALRLGELRRRGARVVVGDAATEAHLDTLAAALLAAWEAPVAPLVAVGSAGLAHALAGRLLPQAREPTLPPDFPRAGPVLVVAGSRTGVTHAQVELLLGEPDVFGLSLEPTAVDAPDWDAQAEAWVAAQVAALARAAADGAGTLVVSLAPDAPGSDEPARFARRSGRLNAALGALVAALASRSPLAGLVLTGGDIARATLRALEGEALQLGPEVLPGLPLGWPVGGLQPGLPLVTKAGGFGEPKALRDAAHFLRHGAPRSC